MMPYALILAIAVLSSSAIRLPQQQSEAMQSLEWVESASPQQYFERDSRSGKYFFYQTLNFIAWIPSVGTTTYIRCYAGVVGLQDMPWTIGDFFESERQAELARKATQFADEYNRRMKAFIDAKGLSRCA